MGLQGPGPAQGAAHPANLTPQSWRHPGGEQALISAEKSEIYCRNSDCLHPQGVGCFDRLRDRLSNARQ